MVEEISSSTVLAPAIQDQLKTNQTKTAEPEAETTTRSGQDTVSISREAQELLTEEVRAEALTEEARAEALTEEARAEALTEEVRAESLAEDDRVEALRMEDADRKAALEKAELERLRDIPDEEPPPPAEEDSEATRA